MKPNNGVSLKLNFQGFYLRVADTVPFVSPISGTLEPSLPIGKRSSVANSSKSVTTPLVDAASKVSMLASTNEVTVKVLVD